MPLSDEEKLVDAAETGQVERVKQLLENARIDVNRVRQVDNSYRRRGGKGSESFTALCVACNRGHLEIVELLLTFPRIDVHIKSGPSPGIQGTPLYWACKEGHLSIVDRFLSDSRVDVNLGNSESGLTPLMVASFLGNFSIMQRLLSDARVLVNAQTLPGRGLNTALTRWCFSSLQPSERKKAEQERYAGYIPELQLLLSAGANACAVTTQGDTPSKILNLFPLRKAIKDVLEAHLACYPSGIGPVTIERRQPTFGKVPAEPAEDTKPTTHKALPAAVPSASAKAAGTPTPRPTSAPQATPGTSAPRSTPRAEPDYDKAEESEPSTAFHCPEIPYDTIHFDCDAKGEKVVLGEGGFGKVYRGTYQGVKVAVKVPQVRWWSHIDDAAFRKEAGIHAGIHHPNIVLLMAVCLEAGHLALVIEYMAKGSLFDLLHSHEKLPWTLRNNIARDITAGLVCLHALKIAHRDFKSLNVLLDQHFQAKVSDFGLARIKLNSLPSKKHVGTVLWMAPEVLKAHQMTAASDVYALGVVFWELCSRKRPYPQASTLEEIESNIKEGITNIIPTETPPALATIIQSCWAMDPKARPTAKKILEQLQTIE
jgi:hypothetical protein